MNIRTALGVLVAALLAAGCASLGPSAAIPPSLDRAQAYVREGRPAEAAKVYEELAADNSGAVASDYRLRAARAWLAARQPDAAQRVLDTLPATLSAAQALERRLLGIDLLLARGNAERAWQEVSALPQPAAGADAARVLELRERVAFASGRAVEGVRAQIARESVLSSEERASSRSALLAELRSAVERGVKLEPPRTQDPAKDSVVRGWLELGSIAASAARVPMMLQPALQSWRARYPNHPATEIVRSDLEQAGGSAVSAVAHVALLLPVSGRQASAAAQIREGFMTAYYQSAPGLRPEVRVYDTANVPVAEVVARANSEGAQMIVGPLLREEVVAAADLAGQGAPILALNYLPTDSAGPLNFYQYALSPENEARMIARHAIAAGRLRGVALVPAGDWGNRVLAAFTDELRAGGGDVVASATFFPGSNDYSAPIQQVLRIDDSKARHRRLEGVIGSRLAFEPRRRGDAQFIFAPSQASVARQLRPQLRFHYAGDLTTYSTSDAYEPHPSANQDLDGIIFPDMPWVLDEGGAAGEVRAVLRNAWGEPGVRRSKLFAFGYDAYQLIDAVRGTRLAGAGPIEGLTGDLTIDSDRRVRRELAWAQIRDGQPQLMQPQPFAAPLAAP